ncbi:MAG: penicillin-binding protein 2 [Planctomycetia bacterium]|nr:penicillin-binding protein 2 [Planctomycetia bacterium]
MSTPVRPVTELPRTVPVGLARTTLRTVQRGRTTVVFGLVLLLFAALLVRLGKVQLLGGAGYRGMVDKQQSIVSVAPLRGAILDRVGRALALSRPVRNVFVEAGGVIDRRTDSVLLSVDDVPRFAVTLSELLEGVPSAKEIRELIQKRRQDAFSQSGSAMVPVRRAIDDPRLIERLDEAKARLPGLIVRHADRRDYPNGSWGGHLLGVARAPDADRPPEGIDGIEQGLEAFLCGQTVRRLVPRDGRGRAFVTPRTVDGREDADGRTAWLSIDLVVQGFCEQALDRLMDEWDPMGAVAIVMDPSTGDVLAMAQRPGFDPTDTDGAAGLDLAAQWRTEVGSTFKPITGARALDLGLVGPQETFELPRSREFRVGSVVTPVRDAHEGEALESGTLVEVIAHSNNPDAALWAHRIGAAGMQTLLADLGVERPFPLLGLPKSREGVGMIPWKKLGIADHLRWGFGHGFTMTPLRLAATFCAFARDDFRTVTPRLVLAVGGETVPELGLGPCLARNPVHQGALRAGLRACVTDGTGKRSVLSTKYAIAGKTGTAKKPVGDGQYYSCSFVGYAPAERPRIVVLVMAQEPRVKADGAKPYGGAVAGPAVKYIVERTLDDYFGLPTADGSGRAPLPEVAATAPAAAPAVPLSAAPAREGR